MVEKKQIKIAAAVAMIEVKETLALNELPLAALPASGHLPLEKEEPNLDKETLMPGRKHLRGVGKKEQRMYEHIKQSAERSGRYGKRAKEVAARTVMKQHKQKGHSKGR